MPERITMFHPEAGTIECSPTAARVHERKGWRRAEGARSVSVQAADGSQLATGTVFPPENVATEQDSADTPPNGRPGAAHGTPTTHTLESNP